MKELITHLITWYHGQLDTYGCWLVGVLMAIESTFLPLPSELVIPFAAQHAQATGKFPVWGVIVAGTVGSWLGATIMYWASRWAGRPLVLRYGRFFMVPEAKLHAAETWSARFGSFGVFMARLLPVVRHLIGIPMGIVKMDFKLYSLFTLLGSAIWCSVLAWVGIAAGNDEQLMKGQLSHIMIWLIGALLILAALYYFLVHRHMKRKPSAELGK